MITANVIHRVFWIKYGESAGTAFTVDIEGKQYLVTAKHIVGGISKDATLEIYSNDMWTPLETRLVGHAQGEIDITRDSPDQTTFPEYSSRGDTAKYNPAFQERQMRSDAA